MLVVKRMVMVRKIRHLKDLKRVMVKMKMKMMTNMETTRSQVVRKQVT